MILADAGNFGTSFLLEILGLVIVAGLIWRYVAPWLNGKMNGKLTTISSQLSAGDEARAAAVRLVEESKAALAEAKVEALAIADRATKSADLLVVDGKRRADEEYDRIVGRIAPEIEASKTRARQLVLDDLGAVVVAATEVVVRAEMTDTLRHRLIGEAITATESQSTEVLA
jgi:F0F1-type ATP synthase membrane subunit b/b'